jgi:hypothetical protein
MIASLLVVLSIQARANACPVFDPSQNGRYECLEDGADVVITNTVFSGLIAGEDCTGGAIYLSINHEAYISDCQFIRCRTDIGTANGWGGACYLETNKTVLSNLCAIQCFGHDGSFVYGQGLSSSPFQFDRASAYCCTGPSEIEQKNDTMDTNIYLDGPWEDLVFNDWNISHKERSYSISIKTSEDVKRIAFTGLIVHKGYASCTVVLGCVNMERVCFIENVAEDDGLIEEGIIVSSSASEEHIAVISNGIFKGNKGALFVGYASATLFACEIDNFDHSSGISVGFESGCRINVPVSYEFHEQDMMCPVPVSVVSPEGDSAGDNKKKKQRLAAIIGGTIGAVVVVGAAAVVVYVVIRRRRKAREAELSEPEL